MNKLLVRIIILASLMIAAINVANANKAQDALEKAKSLLGQDKKNTSKALNYCEQAIQLDPKFADAYVWRASVYLILNKHRKLCRILPKQFS